MRRAIKSSVPWTCDECQTQQPAGSVKHIIRGGRWIRRLGNDGKTHVVHADGDWQYCATCARGGKR